jgi:CheY-like chemotaxis protein
MATGSTVGADAGLAALVAELRGIRQTQERILAILDEAPPAAVAEPPAFFEAKEESRPDAAPARRSVLLIDSDTAASESVAAALSEVRVGVHVAADGNAGLAAISRDRPDIIVIDLAIGGSMAGKDVINMLRATMEWVDIPIVLYTDVPISSLAEARALHGGDEFVPKGAGAAVLATTLLSLLGCRRS